jgi:Flp pilus assembly protein TadB
MNPAVIALIISLALAGSIALLVSSLIGSTGDPQPPSALARRLRRWSAGKKRSRSERITYRIRIGVIAAVGVAVWIITGIPVAALIVVAAAVGVPWLWGVGREDVAAIERLEAVEAWTRYLSGRVAIGFGLMQAIAQTGRTAPPLIEHEVTDLVTRLQVGLDPRTALLAFADALDDPMGDQVVAALLGHLEDRGSKLTVVLDGIADVAATEIVKRRDVHANRAEPRLVTRFLTGLTVVMVVLGFALPAYTRPYHTLLGQTLLASFAILLAFIMRWVRALSRPTKGHRLLAAESIAGDLR